MAGKIKAGKSGGWALPAAVLVLTAAIFVADALTPPDCIVSGLYVLVVLLAGRIVRGRGLAMVCAGCIALTLVAQVVAHRLVTYDRTILYIGAFNALVSVVAISMSGYLVWRGQGAVEALARARTDLSRAVRITTMGELTATIAHEVNQPIAGVVANANACLRWLAGAAPDLDEARAAASRIVRDGRRASEIIARIRGVFTKGEARRARIELGPLVRETLDLLGAEAARHGAALRSEVAPETPPVAADPVQIQQVIVNLVLNGVEAARGVDGPRLVTVRVRPDAAGGAAIEVADNGPGLPDEPAALFEAFVTTKAGGTGMGLAISRSIVEAHQGELTAGAGPRGGAVFSFTLPGPQAG